MKARMPGKAMLTAKQRTLPKALQEKIIKAKINKLTSSIKNISLKKGVMKGVKFAGKTAFSPLGLAFAGGALVTRQIKKELNEPIAKRQQQFNKKGLSIL